MAITSIEPLWEDAASAERSCTCRSSCVMRAVRYRAGRDCRLPAARPAGQKLPSGRAFRNLVRRAGPVLPQHLASAPQAPCAGQQPAYSVQVRDCVSAGSDVLKAYFEVFPKHARTWRVFWGVGGKFGRGISKQVHQNSPSSHMFRCTLPQKSDLPSTEKALAVHLKASQE